MQTWVDSKACVPYLQERMEVLFCCGFLFQTSVLNTAVEGLQDGDRNNQDLLQF